MSATGAVAAAEESRTENSLWRQRAYLACLIVVFALHVMLNAAAQGLAFFALAALALILLVIACFFPRAMGGRLPVLGALVAAIIALVVPLAGAVMGGASLAQAIHDGMVWPQVLVTLFAGRVLASNAEQRFVAFWLDPLRHGTAGTQSLLAAIVTGCCLILLFYELVGGVAPAPDRLDPLAIATRALMGQTVIHFAIVLLFFITLAAIIDAALVFANDGFALAALKRVLTGARGRQSRGEIAALVEARLAGLSYTRPVQGVLGRQEALARLHSASRRLIRALISFLPLLGFLGTVIGLTAAIGGLPASLGPGASGNIDISASLLGLAVKFETTLLGLLGALIASLLLALLEKREGEMAAETQHLIDSISHD
jgi:hypothetical protein